MFPRLEALRHEDAIKPCARLDSCKAELAFSYSRLASIKKKNLQHVNLILVLGLCWHANLYSQHMKAMRCCDANSEPLDKLAHELHAAISIGPKLIFAQKQKSVKALESAFQIEFRIFLEWSQRTHRVLGARG